MSPIASLDAPYSCVTAMMCRLFGHADKTKFYVEWVPLVDAIVNSFIMDWGTILSNNLTMQIWEYRQKRFVTTRTIPPFFMSAYIMDAFCLTTSFPTMGWKWTIQDPTHIHIYQIILWESNYQTHFYKTCQGIMLPIHQVVLTRRPQGYLMSPRLIFY